MKGKSRQEVLQAYSIFDSEKGKIVLADLSAMCFMGDSAFNVNPYITSYNLGKQDVMQYILRNVEEIKIGIKRQEIAEGKEEEEEE